MITNILSQNAYWIINKFIAKKIGLEAALLLSDLITKKEYFKKKNQLVEEEWFFNTSEDIENDTTLSYHKQKLGFEKLEKLELIEFKLMGIPSKQHFKILESNIEVFLKQDFKNFKNYNLKNSKTTSKKILKLYNKNKINKNKINNKNYNKKIQKTQFESFWKLYPKKVNKGKAKTNWNKLCSKTGEERPDWKEIKKALINQTKSQQWQTEKYIPHPTTWLNQFRWLDDADEMKSYDWDKEEDSGNFTNMDFGPPDEVKE